MEKLNGSAGLVVIGLLLLTQVGCVHRKLTVHSQPEGALVSVDNQTIGYTPVSMPFTYYGTRDIRVEKDGYKTVKVKQRFLPPWYQIPPFDFFSDNFAFREIRDERQLDFQMEPAPRVSESQLIDRAEQLRGNVQRGTVPMPLDVDQ